MRKYSVLMYGLVLLLGACDSDTDNRASSPTALHVPQVLVPAGEFVRGSNREDDPVMRQKYGFPAPLFVDEHPQKKIHLDAFRIDIYEVSNKQFKDYILSAGRMFALRMGEQWLCHYGRSIKCAGY